MGGGFARLRVCVRIGPTFRDMSCSREAEQRVWIQTVMNRCVCTACLRRQRGNKSVCWCVANLIGARIAVSGTSELLRITPHAPSPCCLGPRPPKRFENHHAASVSRPFRPKPTLEDPRAGCQPTATFFPSYERVHGAIATCA